MFPAIHGHSIAARATFLHNGYARLQRVTKGHYVMKRVG